MDYLLIIIILPVTERIVLIAESHWKVFHMFC